MRTDLASALNAVIDRRPAEREEVDRTKTTIEQKLKHLIAAVEAGAGAPTVLQAIRDRETELSALEAKRNALEEPLEQRLAVIPSWVRAQLADAAGLLSDTPERAKAEFQRLSIKFTVSPVHEEGARPFLRAEGSGDFEHLAFSQYVALTTSDRSDQGAAGSRKFVVTCRRTDSGRDGEGGRRVNRTATARGSLGRNPWSELQLADGRGLDNSPANHPFQMGRSCHWNCGMRIRRQWIRAAYRLDLRDTNPLHIRLVQQTEDVTMLNTSSTRTVHALLAALALVEMAGSTAVAQRSFAAAHFLWDGSLSPSFGNGGLVTTDFPPATGGWANGMVLDSSQRLIVVGNAYDQIAIACYDRATGALDPSFGIGGRVVTSLGTNVITEANAVAIDARTGDIVVAGSALHLSDSQSRFAVVRYTSNGALLGSVETSFSNTTLLSPTSDRAFAVVIDGAGRITAAGTSISITSDRSIALARYHGDLTLDSTFNGDGDGDGLIVTNTHPLSLTSNYNDEQANGIALLGNDIVIAGHTVETNFPGNAFLSEFLVLRYTSNGALHTGFGHYGKATPFSYSWSADLDKTIRANAIAVDPNGKILAAGRASQNSGGPHFALARLNANGSLDTTFSGNGKSFTSFGWSAPSEALAIAVRGTSSIMLAGWSGTGVSRSAVVTRYTATGSLDTTFDGDGRAAANLSCEGAERATAIALLTGTGRFQTLPRIYVAGYANGDPCP